MKYTSEDTSAFLQLQEEDRKRLKEKFSWVYDQAERANHLNQLAIDNGGSGELKSLGYKGIKAVEPEQKMLAIGYSKGEGKVSNTQLDTTKPGSLALQTSSSENVRAPAMQVCKTEAKSNLFFTPEDNYLPLMTLDDVEDRKGPDKEIKKLNTRLPTEFYTNFLKDKKQRKITHEIDLDERNLKYGKFIT